MSGGLPVLVEPGVVELGLVVELGVVVVVLLELPVVPIVEEPVPVVPIVEEPAVGGVVVLGEVVEVPVVLLGVLVEGVIPAGQGLLTDALAVVVLVVLDGAVVLAEVLEVGPTWLLPDPT